MLLRARIAALLAICVFLVISLGVSDKAITVKPITIGMVIDGSTPAEREPLRAYLAKAMGRPVNLDFDDTPRETVASLADGSDDFACLGALTYIRSRAAYGVVPLVQRRVDSKLHSVFITSARSSVHSLGDLMGKRFAFGDINSTSGHLMPYHELKQEGIDPETDLKVRYSGSHPATAALVANGVVDAGVLDETVFTALIGDGKLDSRRVRVFFTSKPFVDYVYVARKGVSPFERDQFVRALLSLKEGKDDSVLKILRANKFVVANDQEYASARLIARELKMY
jgi:phosphonate transport system substrate-binding protein